MSDSAARWDALTYDGSASTRQVPSIHVYIRPDEENADSPAEAQKLFQDLVSRFYGGPPFLGSREKLDDVVRHTLGDDEAALPRTRVAVAVVDPASSEVHLFRRGDILLYVPQEDADELFDGRGFETLAAGGISGFGLFDGKLAEAAVGALHGRSLASPERVVAGGATAGIWVPLGGGERPRSLPRQAESAAPESSPPPPGDAGLEPSDRPSRFSLFPVAILLLLGVMALFWGRSRPPEESEAVDEGRGAASGEAKPVPEVREAPPSGPPPSGTRAWEFRAGAAVTSSPAVSGDLVLFGSRDGHLYALRREDGSIAWKTPGPGGVGSSPAAEENAVYFGEYGGDVVAVHTATGEEIWRVSTEGRIVSSPAVAGGRVFAGSHDRRLYAFDTATGETLWTFPTGGVVWSSPIVAGDLVIFGSWDGTLYAVRAESGAEVWRYDTGGRVYSSPVVSGDEVYIGAQTGALLRLDRATGSLVWSAATNGPVHSRPAVADDRVVFGCEDGSVYGVYRKTGEILWSFPTGARVPSSPVVREGVAYVGSYDQFLYAIDLDLGHPVWRVHVGGSVYSSPAVGEDRLFVGTNGGRFLALFLGG